MEPAAGAGGRQAAAEYVSDAIGPRFEREAVAFYRIHFRTVMSYLILHGADADLAQDATQNAMIKLMLQWSQINNPPGWVRRVALNTFRTEVRRRSQESTKALQAGQLATATYD